MFSRLRETIRTGQIQASGRPGLATLALIPIVKGCASEIETIVTARYAWLGLTFTYIAGVLALVTIASPRMERRWFGAAISVALLTLVPVFLRWSLQVRADQPALTFATWGVVLMLGATSSSILAVPAGILIALGYLCSQKALYVVALAPLLLPLRLRGITLATLRRAGIIVAISSVSAIAVVATYPVLVSPFYAPSRTVTVQSGLGAFAYYRNVFGYRAYLAMLPSLAPHLILVGLMALATVSSWKRAPNHRIELATAWGVMALGVIVGAFHGGAFPYFWMTLGLFPALAIGLSWRAIVDSTRSPLAISLAIAAFLLLAMRGVATMTALQRDTQEVQRDAFGFISRSFPASARGFQTESALFCRQDPEPFPTYFADTALNRFSGPAGKEHIEEFIAEFRRRPVAFMLANRLFRFPEPIEAFWDTHYVLYRDEVMIPGRRLQGQRGETTAFDVIVPGTYRWHAAGSTRLGIANVTVMNGATFDLPAGPNQLTLLDAGSGLVALAVPDEPSAGGPPFYDPAMIRELDPLFPRGQSRAAEVPQPPAQ